MQIKSWLVWGLVGFGTLVAAVLLSWVLISRSVQKETDSQSLADVLPPQLAYASIAGGFDSPLDIASSGIADDSRLFIVEQRGTIKIVHSSEVLEQPFLDISNRVLNEGKQGLLSLAFHPKYIENGLFYIHYIAKTDDGRKSVIAEGKVSDDDQNRADESGLRTLMEINQPSDKHHGGDIAFGLDEYLYIALGDGGFDDPGSKAQNLNSLLGKILRIDPLNGTRYKVPDDNPFVGQKGVKSEVWSYGWNDPWRISFDRQSGEMFVGDIGEATYEEINREAAGNGGLNYGWSCREGDEVFNQKHCKEGVEYVDPYLFYGHQAAECAGSVTGGYVYRGKKFSQLNGFYVYAASCQKKLYTVDISRDAQPFSIEIGQIHISTFGEDNQGELYFADQASGDIYEIIGSQ